MRMELALHLPAVKTVRILERIGILLCTYVKCNHKCTVVYNVFNRNIIRYDYRTLATL